MGTRILKKSCSRCREVKPYGDFYVDKRHLDGRQSHCKMCLGASYWDIRLTFTHVKCGGTLAHDPTGQYVHDSLRWYRCDRCRLPGYIE